jgi:[protein-PII] uridylyltransferase
MPTRFPPGNELRELYDTDSSRLQQQFSDTKDGLSFLLGRSALVESVVLRRWEQIVSHEKDGPSGLVLIALGDLGDRSLFPYSEIDLLFLHASADTLEKFRDLTNRFSQAMLDLQLKVNPAVWTFSQLNPFDLDSSEAVLSLLGGRYLAGDQECFANLRDQLIPEIVARESQLLVGRLSELTRNRHHKFWNTVFHQQPNVKDGPGGYLDYVLSSRLALISALEKGHGWFEPDAILSASDRKVLDSALQFLASVRCFLNFRQGRDDNVLTWDAQADAALQGVGVDGTARMSSAEWMRTYFRYAAAVHRISRQLLEEMPAAQSLFYRQLETWRTGFSDSDFSVVDGLIFLQRPEDLVDPELFLRVFRLIAQRGFKLSPTAERQLEQALSLVAHNLPKGSDFWRFLQEILAGLHAGDALRAMHSLHLLTILLPELQGIDALAVRDFSHKFTVDEHTLRAIENLHALRQSKFKLDQKYVEVLAELEQPELLYLAMLLHETGKAATVPNHIPAGMATAKRCLERLELAAADRETVLFLIEHHLDMGAAVRRDIFDPRTVAQFADTVGTPDRLKMLCLFTYADIKTASQETLASWKAEDLWQLYAGAANYLDRSVDERVHGDANDEVLNHLRSLAPAAGKKLQTFVEGLPQRYLRMHPVDEILRHFEMANRLGQDPVQLALKRSRHWYELTLVTLDRPFLFATVAGVLAACGMNIVKVGAFSNQKGAAIDTFCFADRFRTLEMNLPEWERFKGTVHAVLSGKQDLARMLRERLRPEKDRFTKETAATQIQFDDDCSAHSTLIEVITQDRPGLLHRISSVFSNQNCNIDIALINTEGQTAIDIFYLTSAGGKLTTERQERLREALLEELSRE